MAEATSQVPLSKRLFASFAPNGYRKPAEQRRTQQHSEEFVIVGARMATQIFICLETDHYSQFQKWQSRLFRHTKKERDLSSSRGTPGCKQ